MQLWCLQLPVCDFYFNQRVYTNLRTQLIANPIHMQEIYGLRGSSLDHRIISSGDTLYRPLSISCQYESFKM